MSISIRNVLIFSAAALAALTLLSANASTVDAMSNAAVLSPSNVDLGFLKRIFGQTELVKRDEGYHQGRTEELERRANGLGAVLAVLVILAILVWGMTGYAWWRLHNMRRDQNAYKAAPMTSPMIPMMPRMQAMPSMANIAPQGMPSGPRLVSQKVIGLPGGSPAVRLA